MAQEPLKYDKAAGSYGCLELLISPRRQRGVKHEICLLPFLRQANDLTVDGVTFEVAEDSGPLVAAIIGPNGRPPAGVAVTVTTPRGLVLEHSLNSPEINLVAHDGNLASVVVRSPAAGKWTIQATASESAGEFYFAMYTTPTADVDQTLLQTAQHLLDQDAIRALSRKLGKDALAMSCKNCEILFSAVIVAAVMVLVSAGAIALTAASPVVFLLAFMLGMAAAQMLVFLLQLWEQYGADRSSWEEAICRAKGHCS